MDLTAPAAATGLAVAEDTGASPDDGITSDATPTFSWDAATDANGIWKYQYSLNGGGWADAAGIGWLAQEALHKRPDLAAGWPCLMVDGFDDLTSVQLAVLRELSGRVDELTITLTGDIGRDRLQAHRRFLRTRERIEDQLGIKAQPLPFVAESVTRAPALA